MPHRRGRQCRHVAAKLVCAGTQVQDVSAYKPVAKLVPQPAQVPEVLTADGDEIFILIGALGQIVSNTRDGAHRGAAASFLTPIATPGNMMVMGPAGYRFGDYWRLGLPVMLWFLVVGVLLVPQIWSFWGHVAAPTRQSVTSGTRIHGRRDADGS